MLKKNIKAVIIISLVLCSLVACDVKSEAKHRIDKYYLKCVYYTDKYSQPIELIVIDSLDIINLKMSFVRNDKKVDRIKTFKLIDSDYYELKLNAHFNDYKTDSILTIGLSKRDTAYNYVFDEEKYTASTPKGFDDWRYSIRKVSENEFVLTKNHLTDSLFKEEYFYDENYKILAVNIYQGNDTILFKAK